MRRALRWREGAVLAFALAVAMFTYVEFQAQRDTELVLVAARAIRAHQQIGPADVRLAPWPAGVMGAMAIHDAGSAVGRYALQDLVAGQPLLVGMLSRDPRDGGVKGALPPGYAAMAIPVDDPASFPPVEVGDRIDLIYTANRGYESGIARALARGLQVVGLRESRGGFVRSGADVEALFVAVTPDGAERVAYALATGKLFVALDGYQPSSDPTTGVDASSLFGQEAGADGR